MGSDRTFGQLVVDYFVSAVEADGTVVAKRMGTSQPFVSRFEHALLDPQMSTEDRYAAAIGRQVARTLVPSGPPQGGLEEAAPSSGARK